MAQQTTVAVQTADGKTLPGATVRFTNLESGAEAWQFTDDKGLATHKAKSAVQVQITFIGFAEVTDTLQPGQRKTITMQWASNALGEVVVTGQLSPTDPKAAVHRVRVIPKAEMEARGANNLSELLKTDVNIRIGQDNVLGSSLSMQGISGQNVKVLVDGVPVVGRVDGNIDLSQINLQEVERVEVVEGPLSVSYGTDALAGTINLVSKNSQQQPIEAELKQYWESVQQYNSYAQLGVQLGKYRLSGSYNRIYFDGWSPTEKAWYQKDPRIADSTRVRNWNPRTQHTGRFTAGRYLGKMRLHYAAQYYHDRITNRGYPRAPYGETAFDDQYQTERFDQRLSLTGNAGTKHYVNVVAARNMYSRIKNTWLRDLTTLEGVLTDNTGDQDTTNFDLWMSRGSLARTCDTSALNYQLGYDINVETTKGARIINGTQTIGDYALFGLLQWKPSKRWTVRPGLRWAYNTGYAAPALPSLNVLHRPTENISVRASYGRGFRAPSLKELYFNFVDINHDIQGNTDLTAETSHNFTLATQWRGQSRLKPLAAEARFWYNHIRNQITLAQEASSTTFRYFNLDEFRSQGVNATLSMTKKQWSASVTGGYMGIRNQLSSDATVPDWTYAGEVQATAAYTIKKWRTSVNTFYKYTGRQPAFVLLDDAVEKRFTADYHTLDVTVSQPLLKKKLLLTTGAKNLFNVTDITTGVGSGGTHSSGAGSQPIAWGRSWFVSARYRFAYGKK